MDQPMSFDDRMAELSQSMEWWIASIRGSDKAQDVRNRLAIFQALISDAQKVDQGLHSDSQKLKSELSRLLERERELETRRARVETQEGDQRVERTRLDNKKQQLMEALLDHEKEKRPRTINPT